MSAPAFAWALDQGRSRRLPTSERMVLVYLADKANGIRQAWPRQETIADYTGLKERQVRICLQALEAQGLIQIEKRGKSRLYHILRPANGDDTPAQAADITPAHTTGELSPTAALCADELSTLPAPHAGVHRTTPARNARTPAVCAETPAHNAARTFYNQEENLVPRTREHARDEGRQVLNSGKAASAPPTTPPTKAPVLGATNGSDPPANAMRTPGQPDDPFAGADEAKAFMSRTLGRTVHLAATQPDTLTEDDRPQTEADREHMAAQIAKLVESIAGSGPPGVKARKGALTMRAYPPGERNVFDADQQQDIYRALTRPTPKHLAGEQLAAARRIALACISP